MTIAPPAAVDAPPKAPSKAPRQLVIRGRAIPVVLPNRTDPRLKLSATISTLTLLGLTVLTFQVSIPQSLVCVLGCALIEAVVTFRREHKLVWPASAIQTGVSVAFIFRVGGTEHGDWWSTRGLGLFALVVLLSMLPKYMLRINGRHVFNPSNIGIVWGLLLIGPSYVFSEHLWWASFGVPLFLSMVVIFGGAWWVLRQVKMIRMTAAFLGTFFVLIGIAALAGHSYVATWHEGPVSGAFYWYTVAFSPELLIFVFFMITDPQTAPKSRTARIIYAVATAVVAAGLTVIQTTEFGIKVAILSSLIATCALVPAFERLGRRIEARRSGAEIAPRPAPKPLGRRLATAVRDPVLVAVAVIAVAAPVNTALLPRDESIVLIEQGLTPRNVQ